MAKSKRNRNIERNERANQLKAEIRLDPSRDLAYIPESFVSHKSALRTFKLTENDLEHLKHVAVIGEKRGQEGIFYPLGEIRALAVDKEDIHEKMIPESIISMQIPKRHFDNNYLERFRNFGIKGTRSGSKGSFYTEETIEKELGLKVITPEMIEGTDYIKEKSVPDDMRAKLEPPELCIWSDRSYGSMEACYLGVEVSAILSKYWFQDVRRKSKRYSQLPQSPGELPPSGSGDLPSGSGDVPPRSGELPPSSGDLSLRSGDLFLRSGDLSLRSGDLSLRSGDLSPRSGDLSPRSGDLSPRSGDLSPRSGHLSPRSGHLSPRSGHLSPRSGHLSPRSGHLSPRSGHLYPRSGHLPLTSGELPSAPGELLTTSGELLPRSGDLAPNRVSIWDEEPSGSSW